MSALINKRLSGILGVGLVALAVGVAGTPASAATASGSADAQVSGLTKKQKKQKNKELNKCKKKSTKKKRNKCKKQVNKKYKKISKQNANKGKTVVVNLFDNYFVPNQQSIKVNDSIKWSWKNVAGREAHNVTLNQGPSGVSRNDFVSQTTVDPGYTFKRTFTKPGSYAFVCTLHFDMTMNVKVSK